MAPGQMEEEMALFSRRIEVTVEEEGMNLRLSGKLDDTRLGQALHRIEVEMLVSAREGKILEIGGSMPVGPMEVCPEGFAPLQELVGLEIKPGFSDTVRNTVGSNRGCSHLSALVMNMGNVSVQGRGAFLRKHLPDDSARATAMVESAKRLKLVDSCVAWRLDGPLMQRYRQAAGEPGEEGMEGPQD